MVRPLFLLAAASSLLNSRALAQSITFAHDIAPIVYANCAACHHPGGEAPFSLLTYPEVQKRAQQIAQVTRQRYMPPWLPDAGDFEGQRRLTDQQIRLISDWAAQGAPEGSRSETPAPPAFTDGWQLGPPDLVLEAQDEIAVPVSGPDVYWNFVFRTGMQTPRYVRAIEIRPGSRSLVHHANLLVDRLGASATESRGRGGFPGMDLTLFRSPFDPDGHFLFWKPGAAPHVEPDGFSWRLDPASLLVLNTHVHPAGKADTLRPSLGLYFTDKPPAKFPLLVELKSDNTLDIPAGSQHFQVSDDFRLPMDADVIAIYPHAHYLGKRLDAYATLPDGSRKSLIRIPDWDPDWQAVYYYREPLTLPKDTLISMHYEYDNSAANVRNPNRPPKRVQAGNQSTDEMAHLWLELLPHGAADRSRELEEAVMRHRLERSPLDFEANFNLGIVLLSRLNPAGAVSVLRTAVLVEPHRADAHNALGLALQSTGRSMEAIQQFDQALQLLPAYPAARLNRANVLFRAGKIDEAILDFRAVIAADPDDPAPKRALALALVQRAEQLISDGKTDEAQRLLEEARSLDPSLNRF